MHKIVITGGAGFIGSNLTEAILTGRPINDGMGEYGADQVMKLMLKEGIQVFINYKI